MIVAGIGARATPMPILAQIEQAAMRLALGGHTGRSGGADGADTAFERGWKVIKPSTLYIYRPEAGVYDSWLRHAAQHHPNWDACSEWARKAHARNSAIICGHNLLKPAQTVLCWTPDGAVVGGTGQSLRVALAHGVPVFNLAVQPIDAFWEFVGNA